LHQQPAATDQREPTTVLHPASFTVLLATAGCLLIGLVVGWLWWHDATKEIIGLLPVTFSSVGKFLPVWGMTDGSRFGPYELAVLSTVRDTVVALVLVYGLDALCRFARIGRTISKLQARSEALVIRFPRMRESSSVGLLIFVLVPVPGTGAIVGTVLGSVLGVRRQAILLAVSAGSLLGAMLIAIIALHGGHMLALLIALHTGPIRYAIIGGLLLLGLLGGRALRRHRLQSPTVESWAPDTKTQNGPKTPPRVG